MRLAAVAVAAALLAPAVTAAPPPPPRVVDVRVGHERASGFVAGDGLVVTVAHVLAGGDGATISPVHGGAPVVVDGRRANLVRLDRRNDLALLRAPGIGGEVPRLGAGDGTRVLGRAAPVVRRVTARVDGGPPRAALVVRADISAGDSGAPLVTASGRVAGVLFARSRVREATAYAVEASAVAALLRDHSSP